MANGKPRLKTFSIDHATIISNNRITFLKARNKVENLPCVKETASDMIFPIFSHPLPKPRDNCTKFQA